MKFLKDNWFTLALIAAVVIMAVVLIKQCNVPNEFTGDKKENDSLKTAMSNLNNEVTRIVEKLSEANSVYEIKVKEDQKERQQILNELAKLKNKHEAQVLPTDTGTCCEILAETNKDFSNYITLSDSEIQKSNNIISLKDAIISNKDSINAQRLAFNQQLQSSLTTVTGNYDLLYKTNISKDKKLKWFKTKEGVLFGLLIGSLIYSATK